MSLTYEYMNFEKVSNIFIDLGTFPIRHKNKKICIKVVFQSKIVTVNFCTLKIDLFEGQAICIIKKKALNISS